MDKTPARLHPSLKGVYNSIFYESDNKPDQHYHKDLNRICMNDTKLIPNRELLLDVLPETATVAELGVDKGDYSSEILSETNPSKLFLIDPWDSERYHEEKLNYVEDRFCQEIESGDVEIMRVRSEEALKSFEDDYFDWLYIDTTHGYEQTKIELELAANKVKQDGIIAGHDYSMGTPRKGIRYGVIEAEHEFCNMYDWKLEYLTLETQGSRSYALKHIDDS